MFRLKTLFEGLLFAQSDVISTPVVRPEQPFSAPC